MEIRRFYRIPQLARICGIPRATLYAAVKRQEIKSMKLATAIYIPREAALCLIGEGPSDEDSAAEKAVTVAGCRHCE
jgi:hypothetical protein